MTGEGLDQGTTPLYWLARGKGGCQLLRDWFQSDPASFKAALTPAALAQVRAVEGPDQGATSLYWLAAYREGCELFVEFLIQDPVSFKAALTPAALAQVRTGEGPDQGTTPLYWLARGKGGRQLLCAWFQADPVSFKAALTPAVLAQVRTGEGPDQGTTALYWLVRGKGGRQLLCAWFQADPVSFKAALTPAVLAQVRTGEGRTQGSTPLFYLARGKGGRELLCAWFQADPASFKAALTPAALAQAVTGEGPAQGTTPLFYLAAYPEGCELLLAWLQVDTTIFMPLVELLASKNKVKQLRPFVEAVLARGVSREEIAAVQAFLADRAAALSPGMRALLKGVSELNDLRVGCKVDWRLSAFLDSQVSCVSEWEGQGPLCDSDKMRLGKHLSFDPGLLSTSMDSLLRRVDLSDVAFVVHAECCDAKAFKAMSSFSRCVLIVNTLETGHGSGFSLEALIGCLSRLRSQDTLYLKLTPAFIEFVKPLLPVLSQGVSVGLDCDNDALVQAFLAVMPSGLTLSIKRKDRVSPGKYLRWIQALPPGIVYKTPGAIPAKGSDHEGLVQALADEVRLLCEESGYPPEHPLFAKLIERSEYDRVQADLKLVQRQTPVITSKTPVANYASLVRRKTLPFLYDDLDPAHVPTLKAALKAKPIRVSSKVTTAFSRLLLAAGIHVNFGSQMGIADKYLIDMPYKLQKPLQEGFIPPKLPGQAFDFISLADYLQATPAPEEDTEEPAIKIIHELGVEMRYVSYFSFARQDKPMVFVFAGRKDEALLPPPDHLVRVVLVLTKEEYDDLKIVSTLFQKFDCLIIDKIQRPYKTEQDDVSTITSRRTAVLACSHHFQLGDLIMLDDNIKQIYLETTGRPSFASVYEKLLGRSKLHKQCFVSVASYSSRVKVYTEYSLGSKCHLWNLALLRSLSDDYLADPRSWLILMPENEHYWGQALYAQFLIREIMQDNTVTGIYPHDKVILMRSRSYLNSTQKRGVRAKPLPFSEAYRTHLKAINPHLLAAVEKVICIFNHQVTEQLEQAKERIQRLLTLDLELEHANRNGHEVKALALPDPDYSFEENWADALQTFLDKQEQLSAQQAGVGSVSQASSYIRHPVAGDGDCGYTAFGITRKDAHTRLCDGLDSVKGLLHLTVQEALLTDKFYNYLIQNKVIAADVTQGDMVDNAEDYLSRSDIFRAYLSFDVEAKSVDAGYAHPGILQALAHIQGVSLRIWRLGVSDELTPHRGEHFDYFEYAPPEVENPRPLDILFINGNHFELLESKTRGRRVNGGDRSALQLAALEKNYNPRPHQRAAIEYAVDKLGNGLGVSLFSMATGTGKTFIEVVMALAALASTDKTVVLVVPYINLTEQAYQAALQYIDRFPALKQSFDISRSKILKIFSGSYQSLSKAAIEESKSLRARYLMIVCMESFYELYKIDKFREQLALVIFDESHLSHKEKKLRQLSAPDKEPDDGPDEELRDEEESLIHSGKTHFVRFSATPRKAKRDDFYYDRGEAIQAGFLAPLHVDKVLSKALRISNKELHLENVEQLLRYHQHPNGQVLSERKGLIFVGSQKEARALREYLTEKIQGIHCYQISSHNAKRLVDLEKFKKYPVGVAIAVGMLVEGFDDKRVSWVMLLKKQMKPRRRIQTIGRVLRIDKKFPDKIGLVIGLDNLDEESIFPEGRELADYQSAESTLRSLTQNLVPAAKKMCLLLGGASKSSGSSPGSGVATQAGVESDDSDSSDSDLPAPVKKARRQVSDSDSSEDEDVSLGSRASKSGGGLGASSIFSSSSSSSSSSSAGRRVISLDLSDDEGHSFSS
jgi:superfamily II DNA or RNA helicase